MRQQSLPPLTLCFAVSLVFVTPCKLHAQPSRVALDETTDPTAPLSSPNGSTSNPAAPSLSEDGSDFLPGTSKTVSAMQINSSIEALNRLLAQYRQVGNRSAEARALGAIASSYNAIRQQQKAIEVFQAELNLWIALGDKKNEATTLAHIGDVYRGWGFFDKAIHFYRDALKTSTDKLEQAAILNNLGLAFFALRDKKKCVEYLDQSLTAYRAIQSRTGEARTLTNLGSTYGFLINDSHKAIDYFQEAITKLELVNDRSTEADALELMGCVWIKLQKQDMAVQSFQRALFLYERAGNVKGMASVRKQLSALSDGEAIASAH